MTAVTGVVLAGGQSRRMGGGDKGLLELAGKPMLGHVIDRLSPQVGRVAHQRQGEPARFAPFGLPVVADTIAGFVGPLAGVLAGMRWSAAILLRRAGSSPSPAMPHAAARSRIAAGRRGSGPKIAIALARSAGEVHPVIGLWPVALADDLETALEAGVRKVLHWTDRHGTVEVDFPMTRIGRHRGRSILQRQYAARARSLRAMLAKAAT